MVRMVAFQAFDPGSNPGWCTLKNMKNKEIILVFAAHPDDEIIGCGGFINKCSKEGKDVITIIFSSGEKSSPWLKKEYLVESRKEEAKRIGEFIGSKQTVFFGLQDMKLIEEVENPKVKKAVINIIKHFKPTTIFTHSKYDAHKDHKAVNKVVFEVLDEIDKDHKINIYVFEVWNVLNETKPRIYVDVSDTFARKIEAMNKFKSQKLYIYILMLPVIIRAIICGFHAKCRYAERFYKVR